MKVLLFNEHWNRFWNIPSEMLQWLQMDFPQVEFRQAKSEAEVADWIVDTEVYFGFKYLREYLQNAKALQWIHVPAVSVQPLTDLGLAERGIVVTNSRGVLSVTIAEHVIGFMLVFSRKFIESWQLQQKQEYGARELLNDPPPMTELKGKTVFILGAGGIGKELAGLCKAFGMTVLGSKKHPQPVENFDRIYSSEDFREGFPEADYLVIALPRTAETDGLIGAEELSKLKQSCVVINVARAKIIDQKALVAALKEKRIRGAALDVFEQEPLPSDSILFTLPNVFLTPHTAGVTTAEHWPRMMELFAENLRRYLAKQPLMNVVDLQAGY
jgi:phosphoglycerate dehydrogenase-like enzyme